MFAYYGPSRPKRPLPSTTCFSTKPRPFPIPLLLIGSSQLWAKHFPYLYPSTSILGITSTLTPMKMELPVSSETSALKTQTPGDYPKDTKRHSTQGESLKSRYKSTLKNSTWWLRTCTSRTTKVLSDDLLVTLPPAQRCFDEISTSNFC